MPEPSVEPVESASQTTEENLSVAAYRLGSQRLFINTTTISINHFNFNSVLTNIFKYNTDYKETKPKLMISHKTSKQRNKYIHRKEH